MLSGKTFIYSLLVLLFVGFVFNVYAEPSGGKSVFQIQNQKVNLRSMSLLDPERFTMKQQTVMSYSSSGQFGQSLLGMYINTMEYRFNMPLTLRLRVAYQNNMGSIFGNQASQGVKPGIETGRLFIPSFDMIYKPWKNTTISFHFRDFSGMNTYGSGNGFGYSPYRSPSYMRY